jgi:DNA-binding winged helix-turn-helix (wHTH) protein/tetratricopeptide (TPR) repeat protein
MALVRRHDAYEFGPFVLESGNALLQGGRPVRLPPKEFAALQALAEARGALVTKDELAASVWGRADVSDESISRCIYSLRSALQRHGGDDLIATIHKRGYRLNAEVRHVPGLAAAPTPLPRVAVLPFDADRDDPDLHWAAGGLGEELIAHLGRLHRGSLAVIARGSVAAYAGRTKDLRAIARDLKLDYVVTGKVSAARENLVVRAELTRCADDVMTWSESAAFGAGGGWDLSPEPVRLLARRIPLPSAVAGLATEETGVVRSGAYSEYLQARYLLQQRGGQNLKAAVDHYRRALAIDPRFAPAQVGIAKCWLFAGLWAALSPAEVVPLASGAIDAALAIDPEMPAALACRGMLLSAYLFRPHAAAPCFARALQEMPNDTEAHLMYGRHLLEVGRPRDAVYVFRSALEFDPQSPNAQMYLAKALHFAREHVAAVEQARRAAEVVPSYAIPHAFLAACATGAGAAYYEEALVAARRAEALDGAVPAVQWTLSLALALNGQCDEARARLEAERSIAGTRFRMPSMAVHVAAALGDAADTVRWLRMAATQSDPWLPLLLRDPRIDALYDDGGFAAAVEEVGLDRAA